MPAAASIVTATGSAIAAESARGSRPTRIVVELIDGRARIRTLDQGYFLAGRPLQISGSRVRLALVGVHLALLAGDTVDVQIQVGAGATLEVVEPSGTVAYDAEWRRSTWRMSATVGAGATLIWHGAEFVAAQGSNTHRYVEIILEPNARALLKETLVLGRSRESEVRLRSRIRAYLEGRELLVEELALTPDTWRLPGMVGNSKVISTVTALGMRPASETMGGSGTGSHRLDLAGPGALWRSLAAAAHSAEGAVKPVFDRWRREALEPLCSGSIDSSCRFPASN